ncbi:MAG: DUF2298 domain-containing protein [Anaerolineae bacterium]
MKPAADEAGRPAQPWRKRLLTWVAVALLAVVGAALRLYDINWDQFQHVHPDERFIVWVADTITWPGSLTVALDPERSTVNPLRWPPADSPVSKDSSLAGKPRNYAYGHFPLYLLVATAHLAQRIANWFGETTLAFPAWLQPVHTIGRHLASYHYLPLVGRGISALADLGTLMLVYRLARRLMGEGASAEALSLLAAAAYAFAVLPIQLSHYATVDALLTFLVTAAVALAAAWATQAAAYGKASSAQRSDAGTKRPSWPLWLLAGALAGLAVGSKFSAILLALPFLAAACYGLPPASCGRRLAMVGGRLAAAGAVGVLVFAFTNPFALIEFGAYVRQITAQNAMVSGAMDAPYTRQYIGTWPYLYFLHQLSQWGLGWPLGIIAWSGLVWAAVQFGRRRAAPALTVMLAWALPYFAVAGAFHAKFLRYMAPLLPFLIVFGTGALFAAYRALDRRWGRKGRAVWATGIVITLGFTVAWAWAFIGVYRQEHPWIAASRWIYTHVPDGSKLLSEHWDDSLPLSLDELPGVRPPRRDYVRVELPLWDPDTPKKLDFLVAELSSADYIVLASDRLSAPIQRLKARYPMGSQYYRLLFAGELGYRPVAEFTAYPRLGGLVVRDDHADESFYVYDHPRVLVMENKGRLSASLLRARLGRYLAADGGERTGFEAVAGFVRPAVRPAKASNPEDYLDIRSFRFAIPGRTPGLAHIISQAPAPDAPLTLPQPVDTLPVVTDFRWNAVASRSVPLGVALWWLVLSLFGWSAWPLLFPVLRGLADRGYGLARAAGWLLVGWVHWLGVSLGLWQNRLLPIALVLGVLLLAGLVAWRVQRREVAAFWAAQRRLILGIELLFGLAYLAFVGVRLLNPDLWQPWNGGEKFMEFAFLNAILRSPFFPPYDPYFAGGIINYYYYGLYLVSLSVKLTGIFSEVAFNLAVPGLFALTAAGVFSITYSLSRSWFSSVRQEGGDTMPGGGAWPAWATAALSVVMALVLGNLSGLKWLGKVYLALLQAAPFPPYDYWAASRVIPYTINEFPLWTFTFADLHPHLIAMPFGMLVVGLALNRLLAREQGAGEREEEAGAGAALRRVFVSVASPIPGALLARRLGRWPACLFLVVSLGALGAINTWDLPTYALLVVAVFLVGGWWDGWRGLARAILPALTTVAVAVGAYWPFYAHYQAQVGNSGGRLIGRFLAWTRGASPLSDWLTIWGFCWLLAMSYLAVVWWRERGKGPVVGALQPGAESRPGVAVSGKIGRPWLAGLLGLIAVLALLAAAGRPTAALAAVPISLAVPLVLRRQAGAGETFVALLLVLGWGVVGGIELVYLRDFLEGSEWYRMNTLFKFSVPAWLFLALAGGMLLRESWAALARAPAWIGLLWKAVVIVLAAGSLVFPVVGIPARVKDRFPGERPAIGTLDGTAYMTVGSYTWPSAEYVINLRPELDAIRWLWANVHGTPVVAEAPAGGYEVAGQYVGYDYYRAGGLRVASLTGLPTFVGQHQYEQRPGEQVGLRTGQGQEFFRTTDIGRARELLRLLRVSYVYIGRLERILFSAQSLEKFDRMVERGDLDVVYRNAGVVIYRVTRGPQ